jgi:hypothetical protein
MIRTMKGEKSYCQINAMSINPSCKTKHTLGCRHSKLSILVGKNYLRCIRTTIRIVMETA